MSNNRNIWERIPFDADEPDPMKAELPDADAELQRRIDALCEHYNNTLFGHTPTGEILGRIAKAITDIVGRTVVVTLVPMPAGQGVRLAGYASPSPPVPKPAALPKPEVNTDRLTPEQREQVRERAASRPQTMGVPAAPPRREEPYTGTIDAERLEELFRGRHRP